MTDVISVRFKDRGKMYYFATNGVQAAPGDLVVVETSKGLELGICAVGGHEVEDGRLVQPLRPAVRVATEDDRRVAALNKARENEAFGICQEKIEKHGLDMKLVDVECNFEGNKIVFFFTSDGRVDFRELVKDLASVFRTRIELRQIGVRDEAKMLGGLGICGRPFCCSQFLDDFQPVSTKMAKTQYMSLNPTKISGSCGRLMCCLRYEQEAYEDLVKRLPKAGAFVETPAGYGTVVQLALLRQQVKVRLDGEGEDVFKICAADEVAVVPGGRPKPGEPLPKVLFLKSPPEQASEPEEDPWKRPDLFAGMEAKGSPEPGPRTSEPEAAAQKKKRRRGGRLKAAGEVRKPEAKPVEVKPVDHKKREPQKPELKKQEPQPKKQEPSAVRAQPKPGGDKNRRRRYGGKPRPGEGQQPKGKQ